MLKTVGIQNASSLPSASTPLAGTEVVEVVQSGTPKKVAVSDLTAGRAVAGVQFNATGTAGVNNRAFYATGTTTSATFAYFGNTGGGLLYGVEASSGGNLFPATTGYATVFGTDTNTPIEIATNNSIKFSFGTAGDFTLKTAGKGVVLTNAAGTVTKRVRLNDAGDGLIFENI